MNGLEMIVELRRLRPQIRVIAMTGSAHDGDADAMLLLARDLGASKTFRKPLDMTSLLGAVEQLSLPA
jgi:CheY-like chemotaxis protein